MMVSLDNSVSGIFAFTFLEIFRCRGMSHKLYPAALQLYIKFAVSIGPSVDRSYTVTKFVTSAVTFGLRRCLPSCSSVGKTKVGSKCCNMTGLWVMQIRPLDSTTTWLALVACSGTYHVLTRSTVRPPTARTAPPYQANILQQVADVHTWICLPLNKDSSNAIAKSTASFSANSIYANL